MEQAVLLNLLRELRLTHVDVQQRRFTGAWCLQAQPSAAPPAGASFALAFHLLLEGSCRSRLLPFGKEQELHAGELLLIPYARAHLIGTDLKRIPQHPGDLTRPARPDDSLAPPSNILVTGYAWGDAPLLCLVLDQLPSTLRARVALDGWLVQGLRQLLGSAVGEGAGEAGLTRLIELMLLEGLRQQRDDPAGLQSRPCRYVSRALELMHNQPAHPWQVEELAERTGSSRSTLSKRFVLATGLSPRRYLARWRLHIAAGAMRDTALPMVRIAERVGYDTEAGFNRAFKREFGEPPASWRRRAQGGAAS